MCIRDRDTLLLEVFESFESQAMAHQLHWDIRLPSEAIPPCLCDEERIRQLLAILIDNAFSYTQMCIRDSYISVVSIYSDFCVSSVSSFSWLSANQADIRNPSLQLC